MDKKILVVDDAMFMRSIIRKILKEAGYTQVWEAQDGEKAMELFQKHDVMVICDEICPTSS